MKKIVLFAALVALTSIASCQKEEINSAQNGLVFTATIVDSQTKTTINTNSGDATNRGKISWVTGDEIIITDASTPAKSAVYVAAAAGQTVNFTKKAGETDLGSGPYTATYGTAPSTTQSYDDYYSDVNVAKNLYMTAPSTASKSLTFTAACGLLKLNLTAASAETTKDVSKIEIVVTPEGGNATIYTLNCSTAKDISSATDFYIALPAGSYSVMKLTNSIGKICFKTAKTAVAMSSNKIQPTSIDGIVFTDVRPGKFSVASGKQVHFSMGNLYYDGSAFKFEANQYSFASSWNTSHVSHFYWSSDESVACAEGCDWGNFGNEDVFFTNATTTTPNTNFTVNGSKGVWRTLTTGEWQYLLNTRSVNNGSGEGKSYQLATINSDATGVYGMIIYPDNYTSQTTENSYKSSEWTTMETAGCVFLPAVCGRDGSDVYDGDDFYYWSSTAIDASNAYNLYFGSDGVSPDDYSTRDNGFSVRLVCAAQ